MNGETCPTWRRDDDQGREIWTCLGCGMRGEYAGGVWMEIAPGRDPAGHRASRAPNTQEVLNELDADVWSILGDLLEDEE